jgi:hypothetical protein
VAKEVDEGATITTRYAFGHISGLGSESRRSRQKNCSSLKDSTFYLDLLWAPRLYQSFVSNEKRKTFDVEHIRMGS